jgi:chromate transporter
VLCRLLWARKVRHQHANDKETNLSVSSEKSSLPFPTICWLFFLLGCTCFGGMWAAMDRLQRELVERRRLLSVEDQRSLMLAAAMIPAPKFLAFAAMVGYRIGGILGAVGSSIAILLPGTILVLAACVLTVVASENPALVTIQHYVGLGVVGLLAGNAVRMFVGDGVNRRSALFGSFISIGIPLYVIVFKGPLIVAACVGLAFGSIVIRGNNQGGTTDVE